MIIYAFSSDKQKQTRYEVIRRRLQTRANDFSLVFQAVAAGRPPQQVLEPPASPAAGRSCL